MRCYKIIIGGKTLFELHNKNPIAPRIRFDIRTYDSETALAYLEIYNIDLKYFLGNIAWLNKSIELHAWIEQTPMTRIIGYKGDLNTLIYKGFISNIIPNYNLGDSTCVTIAMQGTKIQTKKDTQKLFLTFTKDMPILNEVKRVLKALLPDTSILISATKAKTLNTFIVKATMQTEIKTIHDVTKVLETIQNKDKEYITIYKDGKKGYIIGTNALDESDIPALANYSLKECDFLEQPQYIDTTTLQLSLRISGRYKTNDVIRIPNTATFNVSTISQNLPQFSSGADFREKLFFSGNFTINKVWHIGDTHNIQAQQWATNIEAVRLQG